MIRVAKVINRKTAVVGKFFAVVVVQLCVFGIGYSWAGVPTESYGGPYLHFSSQRHWAMQTDGTVPIQIRLSAPSSNTVSVTYQATDGSGSHGATCPTNYAMDYYVASSSNTSGTVSFSPYQTSATVYVTLGNNNLSDGSRNFRLALSSPVNAALGYVRSTTFTIIDIADDSESDLEKVKASDVYQPAQFRTNVYAFEGWGGTWKILFDPVMKDNFTEPFVKKFPTVKFHYDAQDNYEGWQAKIKANFEKDNNRIVLLGYSAGGDAVTRLAAWLDKRKVPVDLAFTIDPVPVARVPGTNTVWSLLYDDKDGNFPGPWELLSTYEIPKKVERWVNLYQHQDVRTAAFLPRNLALLQGIRGAKIKGADKAPNFQKEYEKKDFVGINRKDAPNNEAAANKGHIYIMTLQDTAAIWAKELGNVAAKGKR